MNPPDNTGELDNPADCREFFQQMILSGLRYWEEHAAVQTLDVPVLDRERDGILNALRRGMEYDLAWPLARKLIETLASFMERRGYWIEWRVVLEQAIETSQRMGDVAGETTMTALLARLSQRQSRGADVVRYYRRVMRLAKQSDNKHEFARACSNLGYYYIDASRWWRSEVLSLQALEIFEALDSDHGRAHTHNHLGVLYTKLSQFNRAETHLSLACGILEKNQDEQSLISGYTNLGLLYVRAERAEVALRYLLAACEQAEKTGNVVFLASIWNNVAWAYRLNSDWSQADKYAKKAERAFSKKSDHLGLAQTWNNLGLIAHGLGRPTMAIEYLKKSLNAYQTLKNPNGIRTVENDLQGLRTSR